MGVGVGGVTVHETTEVEGRCGADAADDDRLLNKHNTGHRTLGQDTYIARPPQALAAHTFTQRQQICHSSVTTYWTTLRALDDLPTPRGPHTDTKRTSRRVRVASSHAMRISWLHLRQATKPQQTAEQASHSSVRCLPQPGYPQAQQ